MMIQLRHVMGSHVMQTHDTDAHCYGSDYGHLGVYTAVILVI